MDLLDDDALLNLRRRAARTDPGAVIAEEQSRSTATPDANAALKDWERKTQEQTPVTPLPVSDGSGLCSICNTRPGRRTCNACHRLVCPSDIWTMLGLCTGCASEEDVAHWHRPAAPENDNWLKGPQ